MFSIRLFSISRTSILAFRVHFTSPDGGTIDCETNRIQLLLQLHLQRVRDAAFIKRLQVKARERKLEKKAIRFKF